MIYDMIYQHFVIMSSCHHHIPTELSTKEKVSILTAFTSSCQHFVIISSYHHIIMSSYPQRGEWQGESVNPDRLHRSFLPPPVCNHLLTLHYPGFTCSSMNEKVMFNFPQTKTVTVTKTMTMAENPVYHNNYRIRH